MFIRIRALRFGEKMDFPNSSEQLSLPHKRVYLSALSTGQNASSLVLLIRIRKNTMTSKFSSSNNAVRRISQEVKEFLESERQMEDGTDDDQQQEKDGSMMVDNNAFATWAEPLEDDIFEWHFAIYGAEGV